MTDRVLVSGGSGYIAGFLVRQLMAEGWTVHTTIRSLAKEDALRTLLAVDNDRLHVFAADLNADAGWAAAMAGCSHVAHLASPLPTGIPKDANELIVPARDGALRALRAARAAGVRRFVMTSSVAAISYGRGRGVHRFTEADWTLLEKPGISPYVQSKTIAERAARDWVAKEGGGAGSSATNQPVRRGSARYGAQTTQRPSPSSRPCSTAAWARRPTSDSAWSTCAMWLTSTCAHCGRPAWPASASSLRVGS